MAVNAGVLQWKQREVTTNTQVGVCWLQVGFNVELGGYFSIKRNATSIPGDTWLEVEEVAPYCKAILEVFRSLTAPCLLHHMQRNLC